MKVTTQNFHYYLIAKIFFQLSFELWKLKFTNCISCFLWHVAQDFIYFCMVSRFLCSLFNVTVLLYNVCFVETTSSLTFTGISLLPTLLKTILSIEKSILQLIHSISLISLFSLWKRQKPLVVWWYQGVLKETKDMN